MWDKGDIATLFQNSPGDPSFSPVTSAGQQIGTTLDKSKKSAWTDNTGSTWVKTAGDGVVTVVGNTVTITGATTTTTVDRVGGSIPFVPGIAVMNYSVSWVTAGIIRVYVRGFNLGAPVNGAIAELPASLNISAVDRLYLDSGTATFTINSFKYWEGNHATQPTADSRPLYEEDGSYGCARFDGTDDELFTGALTPNSDMDCFIAIYRNSAAHSVVAYDQLTGGFCVMDSGDAASTATFGIPATNTYAVDGVSVAGGTGTTRAQLASAVSPGAWHIIEARNLNLSSFSPLRVGNYGPTWPLEGKIGGIVLISALSTEDRNLVRTYLGSKVGLTL